MIVIEQVPWFLWIPPAVSFAFALGVLLRSLDARRPLVPFVAGIMVGALVAWTFTPRTEASRPVTQPAPAPTSGAGIEQGLDGPVTASRTTAPRASVVPVVATDTRVAPRWTAPDRDSSGATLHGRASWVRASLGAGYMAARMPRGTVLRVCGPLACFTGTVNDYGPSRRLHPDRIVDLSRARFAKVCGDPETLGTCAVRVWVVTVRPPETDR